MAGGLEPPSQNKITRLHEEIAAEMEGEFIITDIQNFVQSYMPFEPTDGDVDAFVNSPSGKETITRAADQCLRFTEKELMDTDIGTEKMYFQLLQTISNRISSAEINGRNRNKFNVRLCPESFIASDIPGSNNMIDACITLDDTEATILNAIDIAVVFEYTMNNDKSFENNMQAISANVQIMNDDARRMFTFGVTIVKDEVTLWYHSRSHSAVSEPFSFVQNPNLFIKVFMSFLFATEEELGYDPMVIREPDGTYIFTVPVDGKPDRFFCTEKSLSEYHSCNITGRMARVWQVGEHSSENDTGEPKAHFVLKDVWLDASASTEKEIQDSIFEDIEKFFQQAMDPMSIFNDATFETLQAPVQNEGYKDYFLKIIADYIGKTTKPVTPSSKRKMGLFLSKPSTPHRTPPREFTSKRQYRVVFDEICRTVGELETLGEVVDVLQETLVALQLLYCAGWVHRDISSGNILAHRPKKTGKWQAKLSDLEYARRYPPLSDYNSAADPKTGTPYFMPHEILSMSTLFLDGHDDAKMKSNEITEAEMDAVFAPKPKKNTPQVIYNFQHDLESVWWILMWTVTARVLHQPSINFSETIFKNQTLMWPERANCIKKDITESLTTYLEPLLHFFIAPLEGLRKTMFDYYVDRVRDTKLFDLGTYRYIHRLFVYFFVTVKNIDNPSDSDWRNMCLYTNKHQTSTPAVQSSSQPGGMSQPAADALNVSQPGRNKRARMPGNVDYEPPESKESETRSDQDHSEDEKKGKGKKKKGTMSRKKPRTADKETGAQ